MDAPESNQIKSESGHDRESIDKTVKQVVSALSVFIFLFLFALGMLIYYQFYQGHGKWRFTLLNKSNDTTLLLALKSNRLDTATHLKMLTNAAKKDTVIAKTDTVKTNKAPIEANMADSTPNGTVYEVQIGTFENYELKKYDAVFNNLHEEKTGNKTKLTLGRFKVEKEANEFRKDIAKLGIKDAWVVKKVDGRRK